jgi:hypothetical protein
LGKHADTQANDEKNQAVTITPETPRSISAANAESTAPADEILAELIWRWPTLAWPVRLALLQLARSSSK